jgi:predicted dehydrogenase
MRIAVLGCGYWGSKHVRVLHSIAAVENVVAIDTRPQRLHELETRFPDIGVFSRLEDALDHVDAVIIATPPETHARHAIAAMNRGKSVLVEKPLATSTLDARQIIDTAEKRGVVLGVGHTFEYNAAVWKLRELLESGELGQVHYIDSARLNLGLYQSDINVIWDLAPHDVSICNYVLRAKPSRVEAWGARHAHSYLEDVAYLRLIYDDEDVTAHIHVSWLDPCKVRRTTVVGREKMAVYNDLSSEERVRVFDKGVVRAPGESAMADIPISYRVGDIHSPFLAFEEPLKVQDTEFVTCAATGQSPSADGENGLAVVQVLEAAQISLRTGRPVHVSASQFWVGWHADSADMTAIAQTNGNGDSRVHLTGDANARAHANGNGDAHAHPAGNGALTQASRA